MAVQKIIIDCDPGIDDALALVLAHGHPDLELCGITTVAGNVSLDWTTANALAMRDFLGMGNVPVVAGSPGPLLGAVLDARHVHGETGLAGVMLPAPTREAHSGHAVDYLIDEISSAPGEITLVAVGPLTNIALAVRRYPALVDQVRDFVIMGGSAGRGNATPAAEFNIAADPAAGSIVFDAGWTVTMVGLDVTLQARATAAVCARIAGLGRLAEELVLPIVAGYRNTGGAEEGAVPLPLGQLVTDDDHAPAVHDVCAVAHVVDPALLRLTPAQVRVETTGRLTCGMTVTDFAAPVERHNAMVATGIDVPGFWDLVLDGYTRAAEGMPA
ncbi:MAG: nucleoside hydrolase [Actinomycetota bacterium]